MMKVFGEVWWDYSDKPFNYKGILCLESTIAWGFYTVGLFLFLHKGVEFIVSRYSIDTGKRLAGILMFLLGIDFLWNMYIQKKESILSVKEKIEKYI